MKHAFNIISLFLMVFTGLCFADQGGAGGFSGGVARYRKYGDLRSSVGIYFQKDGTFVNAVYNDTLCLNRHDEYQALTSRAVHSNDWIFQDRVTIGDVCMDDRCHRTEPLETVRPQVQWGEFSHSDRGAFKRIEVRIPDCR
ncbi:MAG: hypothetical protein AAF202_12520 [Pseudomonadota bacterium]